MCEHSSPNTNNIDYLLKAYERQQREVYINRTIPAIGRLESIAYDLADAYEKEYRANPAYENEERMRYWRYSSPQKANKTPHPHWYPWSYYWHLCIDDHSLYTIRLTPVG
jgi:hypothetical protein